MEAHTILCVDDEKQLTEFYSEELQSKGYRALTAANGLEALHLIQTEPIHVILSDITMPKMDGLIMLDELNKRGINIPVIFITAFSDKKKVHQAWELGAFAFLEKPVDINSLYSMVENAIAFGVNLDAEKYNSSQLKNELTTLQLKLPESVISKLTTAAKSRNKTLSDLISSILSEWK